MALPVFSKPHRDFTQQVAVLKSRGMEMQSEQAAAECLHRIGYYRLAAYWHPFRQQIAGSSPSAKDINFEPGTQFQHALDLYVFGKKLRMLILDAERYPRLIQS